MKMENDEKFEKKLTCRFKIDIRNLTLTRALESLKNLHFNDAKWCKIWRGTDLSAQNWHEEFNEFWPRHSKISKICPLMGWLWPMYIIFELTKYREVMLDGAKDWSKIWKKTDLCFQKWHEEFGKLSTEHSEISKLELS